MTTPRRCSEAESQAIHDVLVAVWRPFVMPDDYSAQVAGDSMLVDLWCLVSPGEVRRILPALRAAFDGKRKVAFGYRTMLDESHIIQVGEEAP